MTELSWLVGLQFQSIVRRDHDWVLVFDQDASITISCLWRICVEGRIQFTSEDDGHKFGRPSPVDAAAEVNQRLSKEFVKSVSLRKFELDLEIHFQSGSVFQILPNSAGYEAWSIDGSGGQFIAVGGGNLAIIKK